MSEVRIVPFRPELKPWFGTLNRAWLERYFEVEPIDQRVLDDPETHVLASGGQILFAVRDEQVLGTCALKAHGDGVYELTKMAVDEAAQGQGIGRILLNATVDAFVSLNGRRLFLESHDSLVPALKLYESSGFRHTPRPDQGSPYARSNVYMVWHPCDDGDGSIRSV